ncbi:MAG: DUF420 domain-containing protein [Phycisphaerae bacterium]
MEISDLPTVNATLNGISFFLLLSGYAMIRSGRKVAHRWCMTSAFIVSTLFLCSYLTYRFLGEEKKFGGEGPVRLVYFFILITHVILAASVPFIASWTLILALRNRWEAHRKWARITFPIWIYVSMTGVLVYLFLFVWFGPKA